MAHKIELHMNGDGCWPDLKEKSFDHGEIVEAAYLTHGTVEGSPSVSLRIRLDDGRVVIAETTLRLLSMMAAAFKGRAAREGIIDL